MRLADLAYPDVPDLAMGMEETDCGSPAAATAGEGRHTFETLTEMLVGLVPEVV